MGATRSAAEALQSAVATPIAQLSPDLQDAESRAVDGVVTITWPYSVVTKSIAFIIAEQDPLRRRDKGQLRVECHGPASKALADSGIGGGDAILLSLVGAEWDVAHAKTSLPAGSHDWQLKFTKRILLRARKTESQETVEIDIDAPDAVESEPQPNDGPPRETTPPPPEPQPHDLVATPIPRPATVPAKRLASSMLGPDEFTSPAFLKRARVSYGSLFEDGFDVFAEDKANKSKAKRKSRFSMGHTAWKYSSRSPSPEPGSDRDGAAPEYQDGGDLPGEDYDLRNYDRAKDDDESVSESEEASESDQDDPDKAAIDFSEEDEEDEEEEEAEEDEEEEEEIPDQHPSAAERASWGHGRQPVATTVSGDEADEDLDEESDSDAGQEHNAGGEYEGEYEGEYYDDEEDDEDEAESYYDEEEEAPPPRAPAAPAEPVFISLLSDSEDEDEAPPRIPAPSVPPGPPPTKQDERATKESSMPLAGDSGRGASTEEERSFNAQPSSEHEYVSDKDAGEDDDNADEGDEDVDEAVESIDEDDESVDEADNDFATQPSGRVSSVDDRRDAGFFKDAHIKESQQTLVGSQLDGAHEDVPLAVAMGGTFSAIVDSKAESQPEPQPADVMEVDDVAEVAEEIQPVAALELDHTQTSGGRRVSEDIEAIQANPMDDKEPADATATESGYVATVPRHEDMRDAPQGEPTEAQTERVTQETAVDAAAEEAGEPLAPSHKDGAQALASEVPANEVTTTEKASEQLPSPSVVQQAEAQHAEVQHAEAQHAEAQHAEAQHAEARHADEPKPKPELENQPHDEDDVTAEAQIMNEYYSSQSSSRVDYDKVGTHGASQIHDDEPLITVRSLRSHSHRKTLSADTTSEVHDDPSLRLATARSGRSQSPAEEALTQLSTTEAHLSREEAEQSGREVEAETVPQGKKQKETKTLAARRAARNKGDQPMTQGTVDALAPGEDKKLPSHLTLRASRSKSARSDPSLQLSKALADDNARHAEADRSPATRSARGVGEQTEPDVQPAKASPSSIRSARRHDTPETTRELRSRSHGEGRGVTPETVSQAAIQSPSVAESVVTETEDVSALKKELSKMLRTGLPDALPLRSLRTSLNKTVDIMAVSTTAPPQPHRPKHGPRDYMLELIVTDPSTAPTSVSVAHVFRPHLEYLPVVHAGDVVLLRRMQVVSVKGRGFGVRVGDASAWAVFEKGDEELLPQIKGPPVEVTDGEVEYAKGLRRWWATLDEKTQAKISRATQKASQP
ncbi:telomere end binding protein [Purpureocillium lilacinum]|uniref:Telomere end binding protein n=1 Tax=Purpureocillium lilacinum TaxID=33203 RepID=A0A179H5P4_PURLI|nr:telomere end binding protein [Purpureocillium lilacinum]OAQ85505.1 telomere end binding protein [Purpureocillium lilacinum]